MAITIEEKELKNDIKLFTISNEKMYFSVMNYGCTITEIVVPNKDGEETDVVLGFDDLEGFEKCTDSRGSIVGRVANRIANAKFTLNGKTYELDKNDGKNSLHGGNNRYEKMIYKTEVLQNGVRFKRLSKSMEQGFPGNVEIAIEYTLNEKNEITCIYKAKTDETTPINLTNHAYFNLNGTDVEDDKIKGILNHQLQLDCEKCLEIDGELIPTGKILSVHDTIFDFTKQKEVGKDVLECDKRIGQGYDHCFVTNADETKVVKLGSLYSDLTGIKMEIETNQRGVQVYSGNFMEGTSGKNGVTHHKYDGICLETQRYPNAMNQNDFPSCILNPNEEYEAITIFRF